MECPHLSSIGVAPSAAVLDRLQGALGKLRRERRTLQCSGTQQCILDEGVVVDENPWSGWGGGGGARPGAALSAVSGCRPPPTGVARGQKEDSREGEL